MERKCFSETRAGMVRAEMSYLGGVVKEPQSPKSYHGRFFGPFSVL